MYWIIGVVITALVLGVYLWHADRAASTVPPEAAHLIQDPWTAEQIRAAHKEYRASPVDVRPYLSKKTGRRYVVTGGSGLIGGWIAEHLLLRGENPAAIRLLDINPSTRRSIISANVQFIKTDITDPSAVLAAFQQPWPSSVAAQPLTVFHTAAIITPLGRRTEFLTPYVNINLNGTKHVLSAAQQVGADVFIATSSASVGLRAPSFFPWPWQRFGKNFYQFVPNAGSQKVDRFLSEYPCCYAYAKAHAETLVRAAHTSHSFRTGVIRPGHGVYGTHVEQSSSLTWQYMRLGGTPTWMAGLVANFVSAQNVSIGHLALEKTLLEPESKVGGRAYCVTDPNPAIRYQDLYTTLETLAHPSTPVKFTKLPFMGILLLSYAVERYLILQKQFPSLPLPTLPADLAFIQPSMLNTCTLHLVYTDTKAQEEIGYRAAYTTMQGFVDAVCEWNDGVEAKLRKTGEGNDEQGKLQKAKVTPQAPNEKV